MYLPPRSYSLPTSSFLHSYYLASDHPCKLRILGYLETLLGRKRIAVKTKQGFRFACDRRDHIQNTVFHHRAWEPEIAAVLQEALTAGDIFYDIGANAGYFSLLALSLNVSKVFAFEPNPGTAALYRHNMVLNRHDSTQWTLFECALSDSEGTSLYVEGPLNNCGGGRLCSAESTASHIVATTTLDQVIAKGNLPLPTIMKLDVEGWEYQVLTGAQRALRNHLPKVIVFEAAVDSNLQIVNRNLQQLIEAYGYSISHLKRDHVEASENFYARLIQ
jgi:FkbM family methyltransferase